MNNDDWRQAWESEEIGSAYGDLLYKRATGELPEMESSIAAANRVSRIVREKDRILDVGCGSGRYLVSLRKQINCGFEYVGADATLGYVERREKHFPMWSSFKRTFLIYPSAMASLTLSCATTCCSISLLSGSL